MKDEDKIPYLIDFFGKFPHPKLPVTSPEDLFAVLRESNRISLVSFLLTFLEVKESENIDFLATSLEDVGIIQKKLGILFLKGRKEEPHKDLDVIVNICTVVELYISAKSRRAREDSRDEEVPSLSVEELEEFISKVVGPKKSPMTPKSEHKSKGGSKSETPNAGTTTSEALERFKALQARVQEYSITNKSTEVRNHDLEANSSSNVETLNTEHSSVETLERGVEEFQFNIERVCKEQSRHEGELVPFRRHAELLELLERVKTKLLTLKQYLEDQQTVNELALGSMDIEDKDSIGNLLKDLYDQVKALNN